jgi:hypothetical protein
LTFAKKPGFSPAFWGWFLLSTFFWQQKKVEKENCRTGSRWLNF